MVSPRLGSAPDDQRRDWRTGEAGSTIRRTSISGDRLCAVEPSFSPRRSLMAPLGARGRRPRRVVGGGVLRAGGRGGQGDHCRVRAGDRQAGRARLSSRQSELPDEIEAALEAGQPPDFAFGFALPDYISEWAFDDRLVDLTDTVGPLLGPVRSGRARVGGCCSTRRPGRGRCTRCRWVARPTTSTSGRACWSRPGSPSPTSRKSGTPSGRSGAIRCSRRCAGPLGRDDIWGVGLNMSGEVSDTRVSVLPVPGCLRCGLRDPRRPARDRRAGGQAAGSSRRSTATRRSIARAAPRPIR